VTNDRPAPGTQPAAGIAQRWTRFWFAPADPANLHRLRVLAGLLFFTWIVVFAGQHEAFFSLQGWFDRDAYVEATRTNMAPVPIGWSIFYLAGSDQALFDGLYWGSLLVIAVFTLGIATRLTSVLTWIIVVSFLANPATSYDADYLLAILAFYLMLGYLFLGLMDGKLTPLEYVLGPHDAMLLSTWMQDERGAAPTGSYAANLAVRLLQVHFAIIVCANGLSKLQFSDWWAGVAYWYPLHPPFQMTSQAFERERATAGFTLGLLALAQYLALAWQIGFPAFAWRRGAWRILLVGGAVVGWIGSFFLLGLPLFGPFYFICCLSYLHADEWQRVFAWFRRGDQKALRGPASATRIKVASK
jgi:hypothetical protein